MKIEYNWVKSRTVLDLFLTKKIPAGEDHCLYGEDEFAPRPHVVGARFVQEDALEVYISMGIGNIGYNVDIAVFNTNLRKLSGTGKPYMDMLLAIYAKTWAVDRWDATMHTRTATGTEDASLSMKHAAETLTYVPEIMSTICKAAHKLT